MSWMSSKGSFCDTLISVAESGWKFPMDKCSWVLAFLHFFKATLNASYAQLIDLVEIVFLAVKIRKAASFPNLISNSIGSTPHLFFPPEKQFAFQRIIRWADFDLFPSLFLSSNLLNKVNKSIFASHSCTTIASDEPGLVIDRWGLILVVTNQCILFMHNMEIRR